MIQQPELGNRILALRKALDITQEELKEKCHISVRTIQRIESGLVTPRLSTIRILIEALGEDPANWHAPTSEKSATNLMKRIFLIGASENDSKEALQPAWISGIVYLLLFLINVGISALSEDNTLNSTIPSILINLLMMIAFTGFIRGFLGLARLFEIHLLKVSSYLSIIFVCLSLSLNIIEVSFTAMESFSGVISFFILIIIGASSMIFGMALLKLQDGMGRLAKVAGRLEIVFGLSYLSIVFSFIGLVLLGPLLILEIVLLSKADQQVKNGVL